MNATLIITVWHSWCFLQDRLYEIDKSWKNNVVLFGVPVDADSNAAAAEEDPIVTEEKASTE